MMRTKTILLAIIAVLVFPHTHAQADESTKYKMFCSALEQRSTAPYYVVVKVTNKKTGETKELCTEAPFIEGAFGKETGKWTLECTNYKSRNFEFYKEEALFNISFDLYTAAALDSFAASINVPELVEAVKQGKLTTKTF